MLGSRSSECRLEFIIIILQCMTQYSHYLLQNFRFRTVFSLCDSTWGTPSLALGDVQLIYFNFFFLSFFGATPQIGHKPHLIVEVYRSCTAYGTSPLNKWSACCRGHYVQNTQKRDALLCLRPHSHWDQRIVNWCVSVTTTECCISVHQTFKCVYVECRFWYCYPLQWETVWHTEPT